MRLVCPGGGRYVWNEAWQTMESTVYGHPAAPKDGPTVASLLSAFDDLDTGVTLTRIGARSSADAGEAPPAMADADGGERRDACGEYSLRVRMRLGAAASSR